MDLPGPYNTSGLPRVAYEQVRGEENEYLYGSETEEKMVHARNSGRDVDSRRTDLVGVGLYIQGPARCC